MVCNGLRWSAMLLEAQNLMNMVHFIALCDRTFKDAACSTHVLYKAIRPCHTMPWNWPFSCDFDHLEGSPTIATSLQVSPKNSSNVASPLQIMGYFHNLLCF